MSGGNAAGLLSRIPRKFKKQIAFDGTAGNGAVGTVAVGSVTGGVLIESLTVRCSEDLAGATATVALGVAGNTGGLIAATTATDIDANKWWHDTSPEVGVSDAVTNKTVSLDIILTVATANVTDGTIEISIRWLPESETAALS